MAAFIAQGVVGVDAEDAQGAWEVAQHSELPWDVVGVVDADVIVEAVVPLRRRPWFGRASAVLVPMMAYGAIADTSSTRALLALLVG